MLAPTGYVGLTFKAATGGHIEAILPRHFKRLGFAQYGLPVSAALVCFNARETSLVELRKVSPLHNPFPSTTGRHPQRERQTNGCLVGGTVG